ncbi:MAG: 30S ribosomal protein S11 [Verrucomicrobia bacterium]|nr:30S ribosomal protein S11 [Verrucomicrobiota bacterium]MBU1733821.1 30S ribosomal protein S11 [Verrucomicrobiota bacterium]MBU1856353.1 30S ribosomal protein S11 [Verrucomicrobiota bacterium]
MPSDTKQTPKDKEPASAAPVKGGGKHKADAHAAASKAPDAEGVASAKAGGKKEVDAHAAAHKAPAAEGAVPEEAKPVRVKAARTVSVGIAHVNATFNNTQVSITDTKGQVLAWSSSGRMGFRGTRKSTAYAATMVAQEVARQISPYRMQEIEVRVQGPGSGRESAVRALQSAGLMITVIRDVTPMPHNGCRARKRRRV